MEMIAQVLRRQGWGALGVDLRTARSGVVTFTLERSALAEARGVGSGKRCALMEGMLRALLAQVAASPMAVREVRCAAEGAATCTFVATGARRDAALRESVESAGGDLAGVLRALGEHA